MKWVVTKFSDPWPTLAYGMQACVMNVCDCPNGTGALGSQCPSHDFLKCSKCSSDGCQLSGDVCVDDVDYYFVNRRMDMVRANEYCRQNYRRGSLATVLTDSDMVKLANSDIGNSPHIKLWLGGKRAVDDYNRFFWINKDADESYTSGVEIDKFWVPGQPDNRGAGEPCLGINRDTLEIFDIPCNQANYFMCQSRCWT